IKRFHNPHLKDVLAAAINFGWGTTQGRVEWKNARCLLKKGFGTYVPVCYGESGQSNSFIVTIELDAVCLQKYVIEKWRGLSRDEQDKIIIAAADMIKRIHNFNISLPDLFIWHFFVQPNSIEGEIKLSVIDLHRMRTSAKSRASKIKELATFYWSMSDEYFDAGHKKLLVSTYAGTKDISSLMKTVLKHEEHLHKKRILRHHYLPKRFADASSRKS
ncbi:MAG: lipopolysaccharide kinase InaA family protein, partial [Phycisphaerae bacterium]